MKILYVEDNPANVFLVKRVARMGNHEIVNYIDGDKALEMYSELNPDLILMDIQLAGNKSGLDVVKAMRERGIRTPIIAVTAYAMVGDRERCIDAGCDDYLAKPLPIQRLVEMFKQYSETSTREAQSIATAVTELEHPQASPPADDSTEATDSSTETAATATDSTDNTTDAGTETAATATDSTDNTTDAGTETAATATDDSTESTDSGTETSAKATDSTDNTTDSSTENTVEANPDEADTLPDRETAMSSDTSTPATDT